MKRGKTIWLLSFALGLVGLTGCVGTTPEQTSSNDIDYNQYIAAQGFAAYTQDAYFFHSDRQVTVLSPSLLAPAVPICSRADCRHGAGDCPAYLVASGICPYGEKLYYTYYIWDDTATSQVGLYRMDYDGGNRELVQVLDMDVGASSMYETNMGCGYLVVSLYQWQTCGQVQTVYLFSLDRPQDQPVVLFTNREEVEAAQQEVSSDPSFSLGGIPGIPSVVSTYLVDDWVFYDITLDEGCTLYGYHIPTGETIAVTEEWRPAAPLSLNDGVLYWRRPGEPICAQNLETGERTEYRGDLPQEDQYYASCDDRYFYLVPKEEVSGLPALSVYDYQGNLVQSFDPGATEQHIQYSLSSPQYVFFANYKDAGVEPVYYLEKDALAKGQAQLTKLE